MQKRKVAIYIGRFQPLHEAHYANIEYCKNNYDETIVLVGSVNQRQSIKNPFPFHVIKNWINKCNKDAIVRPLRDYIYNETKWITQVEGIVNNEFFGEDVEFTIVGHCKDDSSYYLKEFPNFRIDLVDEKCNGISATSIRETYFGKDGQIPATVPHFVADTMMEFRNTENFRILKDEYFYYENEKKMFENYPFPETLKFNCADAVVVCEGNVLLIQRKVAPGEGVWALPGGFVNRNETYRECALRELKEETNIKVPDRVLSMSIKKDKIFDNPKRNLGIPRISNAFFIEILPDYKNGYPKLPKVKGEDDAAAAKWFSLAEVKRMKLFDDHADIIDYFVNTL